MSKSISGLFKGTKGFSLADKKSASSSISSYQHYTATRTLKDHIENSKPTSSNSDGIKGAHLKENFMKEINRVGAKIINSTPNSQIDGVEQISYRMPQRDKFGNPTGYFKSKIFKKTVYDASKIDTDTYIKRGLQAANNAAKVSISRKLGHEWVGIDDQGVHWHGYCDSNGDITSFFPED